MGFLFFSFLSFSFVFFCSCNDIVSSSWVPRALAGFCDMDV